MIGRRTNALVRHADVQTHVLNTHDKGSSRPRGASQLAEVTDRYAAVAVLRLAGFNARKLLFNVIGMRAAKPYVGAKG